MSLLPPGPTHLRAQSTTRQVAVTIDDFPAMNAMGMSARSITVMNHKLIASLLRAKVPAIGFVNEEKLYRTGEVDPRIATLNAWLDAGFDLGNHTFSHTSLNHVELQDWEDDVVQGESVTRMLLTRHGKRLQYFRHPYLDAGKDLTTRRRSEAFLTGRGYRIAPVTLDAEDWYFDDVYEDARRRHDLSAQEKLVRDWLRYTGDAVAHYESMSRDLLGYEPRQILLLHATWLEAEHISDLLALLRKHGYTFITLNSALADSAYEQPDNYVSDTGASWIDHWAVTRGRPELRAGKPTIPDWIQRRYVALNADTKE